MHGRGLLEMGLLAGSVVTIPMQLLSHLSFVDSTMSSTNATSSGSVQHSSVGFVRAFGDKLAMKRYLENWFNWMHAQCKGWGSATRRLTGCPGGLRALLPVPVHRHQLHGQAGDQGLRQPEASQA